VRIDDRDVRRTGLELYLIREHRTEISPERGSRQ
jgi:hypothetical protein